MSNHPSAKQKRQYLILLSILTAAVSLAFWNLLLAPMLLKSRGLERRIAASRIRGQAHKRLMAAETRVQAEYDAARNSLLARLDRQLPPSDNAMAWIGERISRAAAEAGIPDECRAFSEVPSNRTRGAKTEPAELLDDLVVNVTLRCGYHQLGRFLDGLETAVPLMRLKSLSVGHDRSSAEPRLQIQIACWFPHLNQEAFPAVSHPKTAKPVVAMAKTAGRQR